MFFGKMKEFVYLMLILYGVHTASAARHSLKYFYTAVTPGIEFPEFTAVGLLDDVQFMYYDSNIKRMIPKTEWIKRTATQEYWHRETLADMTHQQLFKANIGVAMQRFNQTQGMHTFQFTYGCEWDDENGDTGGFEQLGYDGEDFLTLDMKNQRYITPVQQAFITAQKWNNNTAQLERMKMYLTQECVEWLQKYVRSWKSSQERTVPPQVSLLQKDPSHVTCHVTGFRPRGVMVTWQKNGQDLDVDVELGETLPNGDGTFQTRSQLRVNPEDLKKNRYSCTVQHKSLEEDIVLTVTEGNIKRNMYFKMRFPLTAERGINPDDSDSSIIIGCVVGALLLLAVAAIGVFVWRERGSGDRKTSQTSIKKPPETPVVLCSDPDSISSGDESPSSPRSFAGFKPGSVGSDTPLILP